MREVYIESIEYEYMEIGNYHYISQIERQLTGVKVHYSAINDRHSINGVLRLDWKEWNKTRKSDLPKIIQNELGLSKKDLAEKVPKIKIPPVPSIFSAFNEMILERTRELEREVEELKKINKSVKEK